MRQSLLRRSLVSASLLLVLSSGAFAQLLSEKGAPSFTRADTLRGMLTPLRACYDVLYYHLDVRVDPEHHTVSGSNTIRFAVISDFTALQVDLFPDMDIHQILLEGKTGLTFEREFGAVFVRFPEAMKKGTVHEITVEYGGTPTVAKNPPWDGGLTWAHDSTGNPWVVVTCQGTGASLWWPNKDHQADEPDSMLISVTVPPGLEDISNGRLRERRVLSDGWTRFDWFVSYPINNYCVTINVGKFAHFSDRHINGDTLALDYFVMPEHLAAAREQFRQVGPMISSFEQWFGKYPFFRDGYKLVECPHTGMEHQSAVAYGNHYLQGYRGRASSAVGLKFDFIIIHESAHEWWGNSITAKDPADMWIHESFGAYAEALFVESLYGREQSITYINGKKPNVRNNAPIIGVFNVNSEGSGDMYDKGQLLLNTLRSVIDNDSAWVCLLRGLYDRFKYQTVTGKEIVEFVCSNTGQDLHYFFDQYFGHAKLPRLRITVSQKGDEVTARYRWESDVADFRMPVKVTLGPDSLGFIYPTTSWKATPLALKDPVEFRAAEDLFYFDLALSRAYIDPRATDRQQRRRQTGDGF
jgi:aminopeptidase N